MSPYLKAGAALGALLLLPVTAAQAQEKLTLERVFASPDLAGPQPRALKLSPDGKLVTLLKPRADEKERLDLWAIDTATGAERMAAKYGVTREELARFAYNSHVNGAAATKAGKFKDEIIPIEVEIEGQKIVHDTDEGIRWEPDYDSMLNLAPLQEGGVISAAFASQICDGASAVLVASEAAVKKYGLKPLARIHTMAVVGSDPTMVLEGPIPATQKVLEKSGLTIDDMDLYEVNEAFGSVPLAWAKAVGADLAKLNVNGGAQALGHPLGATGSKLAGSLIHELRRRGGRYGLLSICEGLGTANATIFEII